MSDVGKHVVCRGGFETLPYGKLCLLLKSVIP
jgi:hypothetical protein